MYTNPPVDRRSTPPSPWDVPLAPLKKDAASPRCVHICVHTYVCIYTYIYIYTHITHAFSGALQGAPRGRRREHPGGARQHAGLSDLGCQRTDQALR